LRSIDLAAMIDHTLLKPETTQRQAVAHCTEAIKHSFAAACVSSIHAGAAAREILSYGTAPTSSCSVIAFPSGAHPRDIKVAEAVHAVELGIDEIDMVIDLGGLFAEGGRSVYEEVEYVRSEIGGDIVLKVIIESAALNDVQIVEACRGAVDGGADFVKTSTGFHPAGGATTDAVSLMRASVPDSVGVKASGGIRTLADALAMVEAGANRIGTSAGVAILAELN
jgi:deoxyribose-phosphate aldolase